MNDPLGDALRRAATPRPSDDADVLAATQQLARSVTGLMAQAPQPRPSRRARPIVRFGLVSAVVGALVVVVAVVIPSGPSTPAAPAASAGDCVLETFVEPSDDKNLWDVAQAAAAEEFVVASGRRSLVLESEAGFERGSEASDSAPNLLAEEAQVKSEEVSDAVEAAGFPPSTILLDFAVRCSEDPPQ